MKCFYLENLVVVVTVGIVDLICICQGYVGWGVLMDQIYIGSLHKFFGSNFSWQLNNLGRLVSGLFVGSKTLFMWRYNLFQLLQIAKIVGPFKDAGALT